MGEIDDRLDPSGAFKLSDAASLGRSNSTMSVSELTEYAGAMWASFDLLEARVAVLDSGATGFLAARLDAEIVVKLGAASALGRSKRRLNATELTDVAGAVWAGLNSLAVRVGVLESAPAGNALNSRLDTADLSRLQDAAPLGRSRTKMNNKSLSEWSGSTKAAYDLLVARVAALEALT
jgi:hypothetical protein